MTLANGLTIIYFYNLHASCTFELTLIFLYNTSLHSAAFMLMIIAYDRYLKVTYLQTILQKDDNKKS